MKSLKTESNPNTAFESEMPGETNGSQVDLRWQ